MNNNLSDFKLKYQKLKKINFTINDDFDLKNIKSVNLPINTEVKVERKEDEAIVRLIISIDNKNDKFKELPFEFYVEIEGKFFWNTELYKEEDKILLEKLINENAPAILLSYVRPYLSQFTTASDLPMLNLPILKFKKNDQNS